MRTPICQRAALVVVLSVMRSSDAFSVLPNRNPFAPSSASTPRSSLGRLFAVKETQDMSLREMRAELDSYGISTRTFLEKREFLDALKKARDEGLEPKNGAAKEPAAGDEYKNAYSYYNKQENTETNAQRDAKTYANGNSQANGSTQAPKSESKSKESTPTREELLKAAIEKANTMRVSELKQKLKEMGINTKSFFEKTEFVRAYAEAIVVGVDGDPSVQDEEYDESYRDVVMQKFDPNSQQRYLLGGTIIDIKL